MTDLYYEGPILLCAADDDWSSSVAHLAWRDGGENDLVSAIIEALGVDEESMVEGGQSVQVHARVRISFDPYRVGLRGEAE